MPGKVSARTLSASLYSQKSSQKLASRKSSTSPTVVVPEEGTTNRLRTQVCKIFYDAQKTTAGHRKLVVSLRKVQEDCFDQTMRSSEKNVKIFDEDDFNVEMARCVIRLMGIKKSEGVGDRVVRFLALFLRHASEKDIALIAESGLDETQSYPETASSRLISHILSILLPLLISKEKTVRYRATQVIAQIINALDFVEDDVYQLVKTGLLKRIRDKESIIRAQAVLGLGRLAANESEGDQGNIDSDDEENNGLLESLLEVLQHDQSADVRRALLLNLPLMPQTLPFLLERARDLEPTTRRALYSRILPALGDFRHLSLSMREKLLRWGLRDRDDIVRKATARLFSDRWIKDCTGLPSDENEGIETQTVPPNTDALLELLERIDVVNSGVEEGVALEAMKEFWNERPDYQDIVKFEDPFWDELNPESVFMARSFNEHCRQQADARSETLIEDGMPEVTKFAFVLQRYVNNLLDILKKNIAGYDGEDEETVEQEFIVEQLLHIVATLDYSDEVGRRKMFTVLREILAVAELPDGITKLVVDVLRGVCGGSEAAREKEFCGVVLEAVAEVHDAIVDEVKIEIDDESFHSARSEISDAAPIHGKEFRNDASEEIENMEGDTAQAIKEIMINMKCLHIAQCMLQNVEGDLQQNVHLVTMLNNLVVPAVRSHEALIREKGLLCLGLCCLLDKTLAEENLTLFLHCFNKGHEALQVTAIHILTDILTTYPTLLSSQSADAGPQKSLIKVFAKAVKADYAPAVQSTATIALSRLMLTSVVQDHELLKQIVICYFDPMTKENATVRQALNYFLPVYCHSRRENMERMATIAGDIMHHLVDMGEALGEEEDMVGIAVVGNMLVEWTDARKLVTQNATTVSWDEAGKNEVRSIDGDVHLDLANNLLEKVLDHGSSRECRKAILIMLGKLYVTDNSSPEKLFTTAELVVEAIDSKIANDAASRNALNKFHHALIKATGETRKTREDTVITTVEGNQTGVFDHGDDSAMIRAQLKMEDVENQSPTETGESSLTTFLDDRDDER